MVKSSKRLFEDGASSLSGTEEESISEEEYNSDEEYETPFRSRIRFTAEQTRILEEAYQKNKKPSTEEKQNLADQFDTVVARIKVWFQNRRAKEKRTSSSSRQEDGSSHSKSPSQQARKRDPRDKQQQPLSSKKRRSMTGDSMDGPVPLRGDEHHANPPGVMFYRRNTPHYGPMKYVDPFPVNAEINYYAQPPLRLVNPQATLHGPYDFGRPPLPYPHPHLDATLMTPHTFEPDGDDTLATEDFHQQSQEDDEDFPKQDDMPPLPDGESKPCKGEYML